MLRRYVFHRAQQHCLHSASTQIIVISATASTTRATPEAVSTAASNTVSVVRRYGFIAHSSTVSTARRLKLLLYRPQREHQGLSPQQQAKPCRSCVYMFASRTAALFPFIVLRPQPAKPVGLAWICLHLTQKDCLHSAPTQIIMIRLGNTCHVWFSFH